jgi:arabinofuranan 3-O-arabinosyltransferase
VLPAGTSGVVTLTYQPESLYRYAVVGGFALLAVIMLIAFGPRWTGRRREARRRPAAEQSGKPRRWPDEQPPVQRAGPLRWVGRLRWVGPLRVACACALLIVAGLVFGGYPGAVVVPGVALLSSYPARGLYQRYGPRALAGLLVIASVCGAVGMHLALSGDIGLVVSAPENAIPQVICLVVIGGMAGGLMVPRPDGES